MRAVRRILVGLAAFALLLALAFGAVQTGPGRAAVATLVARLVSQPGTVVTIGAIEGLVPVDMVVRDLAVADTGGIWLRIDRLRIDWRLADLASGRVRLAAVEADSVTVDRLPATPSDRAAAPAGPPGLPQLPVTVALDRFEIRRLAIGAAVAGEAVTLAASGGAMLEPARAIASLAIRRTDGPPGSLDLRLDFAPADNRLLARIAAEEPSGWLADRLLGRTDRRPARLTLEGDGPLDGWTGRLAVRIGPDAGADMRLTVRGSAPYRIGVEGSATPAPLAPEGWAALVADGIRFSATAAIAGDGVTLEAMEGGTDGIALAARGRVDGARALSGVLDATVVDLAPIGAPLGLALEGAATVTVSLAGTISGPSADVRLEAQKVAVADLQASAVSAQFGLRSTASGVAITTDGRLVAPRLPAPGPPVGDVDWSAAMTIGPGGKVGVERATVAAADLAVDLAGTVDPAGPVAGHLGARVGAAFVAGLGAPVSGTVTLAGDVRGDLAAGTIAGSLSGAVDTPRGVPVLEALLGERVAWSASAGRDADGRVRIDDLAVTAAGIGLEGGATLAADGTIDARLRLGLPRLDLLSRPLATPLSGAITAEIAAQGALERPTAVARVTGGDIGAGGRRWRDVQATIEGGRDGDGFAATVDARATAEGVPLTFAARLTHDGAKRIAVEDLVATAADARLAGRATLVQARPVDASGTLAVPDLARLTPLLGEKAAGRIEAEARLTPAGRTQRLTLKANVHALAAADLGVATAEIRAAIDDPQGRPSGTARLRAEKVVAAGQAIDAITLDLAGDPTAGVRATLQARAPRPRPLAVDLATRLSLDDKGISATVERGAVQIDQQRVTLGGPLRLRWSGGALAAEGIDLRLDQGRLAGSGRYGPSGAGADLTLERLSLASLGRLAGIRGMQGQVDGRVDLDTGAARPSAALTLQGSGVRWPGTPRSLPPVGFTAQARWAEGRARLDASLQNVPDTRLAVAAEVPVVLAARPLGFVLPPDGAIDVRADGSAELARLAAYLPMEGLTMAGRLEAALRIEGTVAAPRPGGRATLANARIEEGTTGVVLAALAATIVGDGSEFRLDALSAGDGAAGRISGSGHARRAEGGWQGEATIALQRFRVLANDLGRATASGRIDARATPQGVRVAGQVTVDQGDINLPSPAPAAAKPVPVVEINRPGTSEDAATTSAAAAEPATAPAVIPVVLDISVAIPGRLFVRGRGLDSEWRGTLKAAGTADAPLLSGSIATVRGRYDLLGKRFTVARGVISFDGDPAAASLDLVATATTNQLTATVTVSGSAAAPTLTLGSDPPLPQDEVLAQVLFGKSTSQMTAGQAVQLAQAAAELAGVGGGGVVDRVRRSLGLDELDVGGASGTSVTLGKYLAEGVFLKVNPNPGENASTVEVEIEVRPNVTVDAGVGGTGSSVGLKYRFDY